MRVDFQVFLKHAHPAFLLVSNDLVLFEFLTFKKYEGKSGKKYFLKHLVSSKIISSFIKRAELQVYF